MGKASNAAKDRWNARSYDDIRIRIPKGRKNAVEEYAKEHGVSVNGLVNQFLRDLVGMSEEEWKQKDEE